MSYSDLDVEDIEAATRALPRLVTRAGERRQVELDRAHFHTLDDLAALTDRQCRHAVALLLGGITAPPAMAAPTGIAHNMTERRHRTNRVST